MTDLFPSAATEDGPVECLGRVFENEPARRAHFAALLAEKLKDPEFRNIEGFPQGTDEAILAMSDPPYYTACPNPFLQDFVRHYGKPYDPAQKYSREPLAIDVSVGKTDPIYKAHSYHTKVPHLAIVPSILHYTEPGDLVLDGFAGSGMTGVAAQWCGSAPAQYRYELEADWKKQGRAAPQWGARRVILNDLSPAATFIAANYNLPFDVAAFAKAGKQLLDEVEQELGWMYETLHSDGKTKGRIEYTVWSEIFTCPHCAGEVNFIVEALDAESKRVKDAFPCPHCGANLNKDNLDRIMEARIDPATGNAWNRIKFNPALISYTANGEKYSKFPDNVDITRLTEIGAMPFPKEIPTVRFPIEKMYHGSRINPKGFSHVHHFFLERAGQALGLLWQKANNQCNSENKLVLRFFIEQAITSLNVQNRYGPHRYSQSNGAMPLVYYVPSQISEVSPWYVLSGKLNRLVKTFQEFRTALGSATVTTGSATRIPIQNNMIDYIFTDPPFGENIFYADLNFLVESWHGVSTNSETEAIVDKFKKKALPEYQHLMRQCFAEYYRVLKPGRWMTVVFSNSKASVWNAIQLALQQAGFVVAEVTALDKVQGSYRQVTSTTAVKQDLVISAYKPNGGLEDRFNQAGGTSDSVWDFVRTHLGYLPITKAKGLELEFVVERDPRIIYDRLIAWFVRHNMMVPMSSQEFQSGLAQKFSERDGMVFLDEQAAVYDKKRQEVAIAPQMEMFVSDERSAIDWLADFLKKRPSTYAEIHTEYIPTIGVAKKKGEIIPELGDLLDANFLQYEGVGEVPGQIHGYLSSNFKELRSLGKTDAALVNKAKDRWYVPDPNKAQDLEKKREKSLLKEFAHYQAAPGRRLKEFRLEVLRAGFRKAWGDKEYQTIISIAQKIPEDALQEDEKLLLWYDQAITRLEAAKH